MQQRKKKKSRGGLCGVIVAVVLMVLVVSCVAAHDNASTPQSNPLSDQQLAATNAANVNATDAAINASNLQLTVTIAPVDTPTPVPQPTHQATPKPTPRPTQPPACQSVNNNPWCYNFSSGKLIYNPPSNFCDYFNCISSFWNGSGFVNECQDGSYSLSGGHQGDCSHHGGESRPLYSH
jgi:hypothetical protein